MYPSYMHTRLYAPAVAYISMFFYDSNILSIFLKSIFWIDHLEMELEAHIWCVSSTYEYYLHAKYELPTPSLDGRTSKCVSGAH